MPAKVETPLLACYKSLVVYTPKFADFVIWSGWIRTWYGVVNNYDAATDIISIIFEGSPKLLFTLTESEMRETTYYIKLSDIRNHKRGAWYIQQTIGNQSVWYI
jgi:hypothetical protein